MRFYCLFLVACAAPPSKGGGGETSTFDAGPADTASVDSGEGGVFPIEDNVVESVEGMEDRLFDPLTIHRFDITLGSAAKDALNRRPDTYVAGTFRWGTIEREVGVRIKGSSSRDDFYGKPSLKVDFTFADRNARLAGQKKLNMHNMVYDPMKVSEALSYQLFRDAGLPASETGYARLYVDGDDYGLYSLVEVPSDPFLDKWYDDPHGNLYENAANYCDLDDGLSCFEAEEYDEGDHTALLAFMDAAAADGFDALRSHVDPVRFPRFLAMEAAIAHWDSYSFDQSNYRWYHEPTAGTWSLIPSSMDLDYGYRPWSYPECGRHGVDPSTYTMGLVSARCFGDDACLQDVVDEMALAADLLESADVVGRLDILTDLVRDDVYSDPRKYTTNSHFESHIACVRTWLEGRPAELRDWVNAQR